MLFPVRQSNFTNEATVIETSKCCTNYTFIKICEYFIKENTEYVKIYKILDVANYDEAKLLNQVLEFPLNIIIDYSIQYGDVDLKNIICSKQCSICASTTSLMKCSGIRPSNQFFWSQHKGKELRCCNYICNICFQSSQHMLCKSCSGDNSLESIWGDDLKFPRIGLEPDVTFCYDTPIKIDKVFVCYF